MKTMEPLEMVNVLNLAAQEKRAHEEAQQQAYYKQTWRRRLYTNLKAVVGFTLINMVIFTTRMVLQGYRLDQLRGFWSLFIPALLIFGTLFSIQDARFNFKDYVRRQQYPIQWAFILRPTIIFGIMGAIMYAAGLGFRVQHDNHTHIATDSTLQWALIGMIDGSMFGLYSVGQLISIDRYNSRPTLPNSACTIVAISLPVLCLFFFLITRAGYMSFFVLIFMAVGWTMHFLPKQGLLPTAPQ